MKGKENEKKIKTCFDFFINWVASLIAIPSVAVLTSCGDPGKTEEENKQGDGDKPVEGEIVYNQNAEGGIFKGSGAGDITMTQAETHLSVILI